MRSDPKLDKELRARCTTELYTEQAKREGLESFVLHDGPPYANGDLHMGHFLNKVLKDAINRYKILQGYNIDYTPGWDTHGLPIELKAVSAQESEHASPLKIRATAKKFALNAVQRQKESFQSWNVMADWDNSYQTLDPSYEAEQLEVFKRMVDKGYIYRAKRPVHWSPVSRTALAEAELEYADNHISPAVFVGLPLRDLSPVAESEGLGSLGKVRCVIWTTTPWTLPANLAICFHPEIMYCLVSRTGKPLNTPEQDDNKDNHVSEEASQTATSSGESVEKEYLMLAVDRVEHLSQKLNEQLEVVKTFPGSVLEGCMAERPFPASQPSPTPQETSSLERHASTSLNPNNPEQVEGEDWWQCPLLPGDHVTVDAGSGLVHTAPGHGVDDFNVGKKYKLPAFSPINDSGHYTSVVGSENLEGCYIFKDGNDRVIQDLRDRDQVDIYIYGYVYKY